MVEKMVNGPNSQFELMEKMSLPVHVQHEDVHASVKVNVLLRVHQPDLENLSNCQLGHFVKSSQATLCLDFSALC